MVTHNKLNIYCYYVLQNNAHNSYVNRQTRHKHTVVRSPHRHRDRDQAKDKRSARAAAAKEKYGMKHDGHMNANKFPDKSKHKTCIRRV